MNSGRELFEHELRDIFDAENKLLGALENMSGKVSNEQLSQSFAQHRDVTERQVERLEQVFKAVDRTPRREPCKGINGLIEEFSSFVQDKPSPDVLNVFAANAAIKIEHYEICAYKSLIRLADQLGLTEAAELFEQNLKEEQETAQELDAFAEKIGHELPA